MEKIFTGTLTKGSRDGQSTTFLPRLCPSEVTVGAADVRRFFSTMEVAEVSSVAGRTNALKS